MKNIFAVLLLAGCGFIPAQGQEKKAPSTSEVIKQLEREWTDAQKAGDISKLSQIIADDWSGLGMDGNKSAKADFLNNIKSGRSKTTTFEFGPMDVKVLGNVAIVQGSDTEKSVTNGQDSSGKWVWMDVFVKRDGKWQAVRSQSALVK